MKGRTTSIRPNLKVIFIFGFIIFYFNFLIGLYIIPNKLDIPWFLLIGFGMIIACIFYFFLYLRDIVDKKISYKFNFLNENYIKSCLMDFFVTVKIGECRNDNR